MCRVLAADGRTGVAWVEWNRNASLGLSEADRIGTVPGLDSGPRALGFGDRVCC